MKASYILYWGVFAPLLGGSSGFRMLNPIQSLGIRRIEKPRGCVMKMKQLDDSSSYEPGPEGDMNLVHSTTSQRTYQEVDPYPVIRNTDSLEYLYNFGSILMYSTLAFVVINNLMFFGGNAFQRMFGQGAANDRKNQILVEKQNITLSSFIGSPEIFEECTEVISFMKEFQKYKQHGIEIPRGILLEGPPGCGKTLLAKVIASECDTNFVSASGSEFVELYVGNGAARIRRLFETARNSKPCVIFIDEIDAVGRLRSNNPMASNNEQEQTLNQLLYEMDGFQDNDNILVIGSTNRRDILDTALLRPGRFDRIIYVPTPDKASRKKIIANYLGKRSVENSVYDELDSITELTRGMSGAELKNMVNEAGIESIKRNSTAIQMKDLYRSLDKITMGVAKANDERTDEMKRLIAVHELGHAILVNAFHKTFQFSKVTIQATYKGMEGCTVFHMKNDMLSKLDLKNQIIALLGGRAAEELYYGKENCSIGASRDLQEANDLAYQMINTFGFGRQLTTGERYSDITKSKVEKDIILLLDECYREAMNLLKKHKELIDILIDELLKKETIYHKEFPNLV
jgi:cell division protease FtsH